MAKDRLTREEIAPGVFYSFIDGNYRRNKLLISLRMPMKRETVTATALIPYLLDRGTSSIPDKTKLKRKLDMLYGADLQTYSSSQDGIRMVNAYIAGADESILGAGRVLSEKRTKLLYESLYDPYLLDGAFPEKHIETEKEVLRERILSEIDDKRLFCLRNALKLFYGNDIRGIPNTGYVEDLDALQHEELRSIWKGYLEDSTVEIINVSRDGSALRNYFAAIYKDRKAGSTEVGTLDPIAAGEVKRETKHVEAEQDKLVMIYTAGRQFSEREKAALRVFSALFGGIPTSRLFTNVRERDHLCYYCSSSPFAASASLLIDSGVSRQNCAKIEDAVSKELELFMRDGIGDDEFMFAKLALTNAYKSIRDSADSLSSWYLGSILRRGYATEPDDDLALMESIGKDDVLGIASSMKLAVVERVTGE